MTFGSLLPRESFRPIFEPLIGKKIGFVVSWGNVGDWLIEEAAIQLFHEFGIDFKCVNQHTRPHQFDQSVCAWADEFVFNGGGSMGDLYPKCQKIRSNIFIYEKPITVLPSSFTCSREDYPYKKVWVRENMSLQFREDAELAPDLVLGYQFGEQIPDPIKNLGIFLRQDKESSGSAGIKYYQDPVQLCKTPQEYILLAAQYEHIITNRLHFAIAGLIAGREVTLLPNSYFKNRAVWECWLKDLGCLWSESLPDNPDGAIIAFTQLGNMGRLGNQMFQYAFLRGTAQKLGVKFYCPHWKGQDVFLLHDSFERSSTPLGIKQISPQSENIFLDPNPYTIKIEQGMDICGYFMSEKYFSDKNSIRTWFCFDEEKLISVKQKYKDIDFTKSCSLHLRFTDMTSILHIYSPSKKYYHNALKMIGKEKNILVFSDDIVAAKKFLKEFRHQFIFMDKNTDFEDLYLMSRCHDCICSASSFSWWGAWLNKYPNKIIICPKERYTLGAPFQNNDFWPDDWIKIDSGRRFWNLYILKKIKVFFIGKYRGLMARAKKWGYGG